jgi:rifampicin phosphotransferase
MADAFNVTVSAGAFVGHPASAGRAAGVVHVVHGPRDFAGFADGDVLVDSRQG